jgi:serine/threonine-protein kinase
MEGTVRLAVFIALLLPSLACAQDFFGSIVYSIEARQYGWANNQPSREAAEQAAMGACRKLASDCRVLVWFRNSCGALATASKSHAAETADTQSEAEAKAMKLCAKRSRHCKVTRSFCTGG